LFGKHVGIDKSGASETDGHSAVPLLGRGPGLSSFLALPVIIIIFAPMIRLSRPGRIGFDLVFAFMLFSGAVATIRQNIFMYLVVGLTVLEFAADLIVEFNSSIGHLGWDMALRVSGLAILVVMTLRHTFRPGRVSVHRVMGG
jgi:hypothetical protein